ncbi:hypothetical protein LR48_Vigan09g092500 [Vigna angularis]|uniref:Uncharacterized protein n=1 Tax=Phaseolus angularis TaxID=3914 RepID=A0A0L9VB21_PHAAN|nr:hypothetical protein LR48_Vigan09g092500 [Vigna angularis]
MVKCNYRRSKEHYRGVVAFGFDGVRAVRWHCREEGGPLVRVCAKAQRGGCSRDVRATVVVKGGYRASTLRIGNLPATRQLNSQVSQSHVIATSVPINSVQFVSGTGQAVLPSTTATVIGTSSLSSDTSIFSDLPADSKRNPRRAKTLLDSFPASDKSFSRLLGEVPLLPESSLKILNDVCYFDIIGHDGKVICDIERVTQGLGAIWSLILGRPQNRQACLGIAWKETGLLGQVLYLEAHAIGISATGIGCFFNDPGDDLRSRILRLRLPKRSATNILQKWVLQGNPVTLSQLRDISKEL